MLGGHIEVGDVELVLLVPADGTVVSPLFHHTMEETQAEQETLERDTSLATRVEVIILIIAHRKMS